MFDGQINEETMLQLHKIHLTTIAEVFVGIWTQHNISAFCVKKSNVHELNK